MSCEGYCKKSNQDTRQAGGQTVTLIDYSDCPPHQIEIEDWMYDLALEMDDDVFERVFHPIFWYDGKFNKRKVKCASCKTTIPKGEARGWNFRSPFLLSNNYRYYCPACHARQVKEIKLQKRADKYRNKIKLILSPPGSVCKNRLWALRQSQFDTINYYAMRLPADQIYGFYLELYTLMKGLPEATLNDYLSTTRIIRSVMGKYPLSG